MATPAEYEPLLGAAAKPPPERATIPTRGLPDPLLLIGEKRRSNNLGGDNMVKKGKKNLSKMQGASDQAARGLAEKERVFRFAVLVFLPTIYFAVTLAAIYRYWLYNPLTMFWYVLVTSLTIVFLYRWPGFKKEWQHVALRSMLFALVCSLALGAGVFYKQWIYFLRYRDLRQHTNVAGSQNAEAFADAGMVRFTQDTTVDSSKAVGYLSARAGARLCVAPVVDATAQPSEPVSFFAIGINCCSWRGSFGCDDAGDADARGALLELDATTLTGSPLIEWLVDDSELRQDFLDALKLEKSAFGTLTATNPRFLRWVKDPVDVMNNYWRTGFWTCVAGTGIFGGFTAWYVLSDKGGTTRPMQDILAAAGGPVASA